MSQPPPEWLAVAEKMRAAQTGPHGEWVGPPLTEEDLTILADETIRDHAEDVERFDGVVRARVRTDFTCHTCGARYTCPFVFDPYNTDGDCLASK